jgi:hypothetical protein
VSQAEPLGLEQAFSLAAGELGMMTAAWSFIRVVRAERGVEGVNQLRDELGRLYPVLDAVAAAAALGGDGPVVKVERALRVLEGTESLLVVGLETSVLDALLPRLRIPRVALLKRSPLPVDWGRLASNYPGVELLDLDHFQLFAGPRSALLTFAYGGHGEMRHVSAGWLRVMGADVRTQFQRLVGWDVLGTAMFVFPRWLQEAHLSDFTHFISAEDEP